jgi:iron complex transport system permease protein
MASGVLTHFLALSNGRTETLRLILMGVLVSSVLTAFTTAALLGAQETEIHRILRWTIGSTNGRVWAHVWMILPWLACGLVLAFMALRSLNALHLGEETATGLGVKVELTKLRLLFVASVLTAGSVAVVGAIGLVGLIAPRVAHAVLGQDARRLVPGAALVGASLLLVADIGARTIEIGWLLQVAGATEPAGAGLPVGAVTALFGVPLFLWIMLKSEQRS